MKPLLQTRLRGFQVTVARRTYPDEDQRAGISHFVLPLRHLDHGKLSGTGALAQNLPHLRTTEAINTQTQTQPSEQGRGFCRQTIKPADGVGDVCMAASLS